ncbi:uncharacterized protein LOC113334240 isoform X4 [Papaver somniferum]|nr:uncharacterized protein LOC113334240 isoform X4 [Papaver somniferum]
MLVSVLENLGLLSRVAAVEKGEANEKVPLSTSFSRVAAQDVQRWLSQIRAATRDNPNRDLWCANCESKVEPHVHQ